MIRITVCAFLATLTATAADIPLPPAFQKSFQLAGIGNIVGFGFDAIGNMYVAGTTGSGGLAIPNKTILGPGGEGDLSVIRLSAAGQVLHATSIGGSSVDDLSGMAVDGDGNVYLAGRTDSADFPTTAGGFQPHSAHGGAFLLKLDPFGTQLLYSTYLDDRGTNAKALAIDSSGNAYIAGVTNGVSFPTTAGAYMRTIPADPPGGFVTKVSADGKTLLFSTLFDTGYVSGIGIGTNGVINITGKAYSGSAFFAKLNSTGSQLLYSTTMGGGGALNPRVTVDRLGNSYVLAGRVVKFDADGSIVYSKQFTGAQGVDLGTIHVEDDGTLLIGGLTSSPDFPTKDTLQPCRWNLPHDPGSDFSSIPNTNPVFIVLDPAGNVTLSTFLGGVGYISAIARNASGAIYLAGGIGFSVYAARFDPSQVPHGMPAPACMVHSATFAPAPAVPALIATLYGSNLGPSTGAVFQLDTKGRIPTQLAGTGVKVNGVASPILYAQDGQINFVVPQGLTGDHANVCVTNAAGQQTCVSADVAAAAPAIFRVGTGYALLNTDGTLNTASNPATRGSVISLWGTGLGPNRMTVPDGSVGAPVLNQSVYAVHATFPPYLSGFPCNFGGCPTIPPTIPTDVLFAGAAPYLVTGVTQINLRIPETAATGNSAEIDLQIDAPGTPLHAIAYVFLK